MMVSVKFRIWDSSPLNPPRGTFWDTAECWFGMQRLPAVEINHRQDADGPKTKINLCKCVRFVQFVFKKI